MIKVTGVFEEHAQKVALIFDIPEPHFKNAIEHINNNMFLSFKRPNSKFREILLCSVGDHLDKENRQDVTRADLAIYIAITKQVDKAIAEVLEKEHTWYICMKNKNSVYMFSIDKDTEYIKERRAYNVG